MFTATPPSTSILVIGLPLIYPLRSNNLRCLRSLSYGFSNIAGTGSRDSYAMDCSTSSSDGALNSIGKMKTMLIDATSTPSAFSLAHHTCDLWSRSRRAYSFYCCSQCRNLSTCLFYDWVKPSGHHLWHLGVQNAKVSFITKIDGLMWVLVPSNITTERAVMMPADAMGVAGISWTTNKSASAQNNIVAFYPGVYRGVIYISTGKAANGSTYAS